METIRFTEKRKTTKWPAIIVMVFLIIGGGFVAYAINNEDNPKMLGFSSIEAPTESDGLENVGQTDAEKLAQAMNLNYEIKDISSVDKSTSNFVSDIHLPTIYVDGKEITELNAKIQAEYTTRFDNLKEQMTKAESNYSFNVTYTYFDNIVGLKKIVSLVIKQQIIDVDSQKVTSEKVTTYNVDLSAKKTLAQADVLLDLLGKDYKDTLKKQVKDYVVNAGYIKESEYNYEITGLENFYIQDSKFHIVFNGDSDNIVDSNDVIDIEIQKNEEGN
ncbi:MAG: hypothetical protein ACI4ON_07475 [Clostridia bacterium]